MQYKPAFILAICVFNAAPLLLSADDNRITPVETAHAHNDYLHARPLLDALDQGFCSVEADIFLVDGRLLVAHSAVELSDDRTLEGLYLEPLRQRISDNGGRVYRDGPVFTLLIDIKSEGVATYLALHKVLSRYADILSSFQDGRFQERAITAIVSGNRAVDVIAAASPRFVGIECLSSCQPRTSSDSMNFHCPADDAQI